jgi:opacity protein-like surface antigen
MGDVRAVNEKKLHGRSGFGISNSSKFTWQAEGTISYKLSQLFTLIFGYRLLSFDTVKGSGSEKKGTDLLQHGPVIGIGVNF